MKIHEYQAKAILGQYHVPVPRGEVAFTAEEAETAAKSIGGSVVVKAQIHAGGRGKGGGVKVAKNAAEAAEIARHMIGMKLVTHQTGPDGRIVQRLLVEETLPIERELYLGIVLDRVQGRPVFMASAASLAIFTPPPLPRPPAWICAFTTTLPPIFFAAASASSTVRATSPLGTGTAYLARRLFA